MEKRNRGSSEHTHMIYVQQGDVLLFCVAKMPVKVIQKLDGILVRGEATGHAHRLTEASDGLLYEAENGTLYLRVGLGGATITHEEHDPLQLPPGEYRVGRVQEYDHFLEEARSVRD